jgi:hypothetical protein
MILDAPSDALQTNGDDTVFGVQSDILPCSTGGCVEGAAHLSPQYGPDIPGVPSRSAARRSHSALRRRPSTSPHILGGTGLANVDAELEQFTVYARRAPRRVGNAHLLGARPRDWPNLEFGSANSESSPEAVYSLVRALKAWLRPLNESGTATCCRAPLA